MIRLIPPVAVPSAPRQIAASLLRAGPGSVRRFAQSLGEATGLEGAELFSSGRAALATLLSGDDRRERNEVLMPAYTCWSVPAAAVRAGLRPRLVDVDPSTLDLDLDSVGEASWGRARAAVLAHLFSRSCDVETAASRIRRRDPEIRIVEDAAQAWPDRSSRLADSVLLSFGRGKPLPLGGGGALFWSAGEKHHGAGGRGRGVGRAIRLALTGLLGRPASYRIAESLPFLGIGATIYDPNFDVNKRFTPWEAEFGIAMLERLTGWSHARTAHAARLAGRIESVRGWSLPAPAYREGPVRFPVLAPSREARQALLIAMRRRGVACSSMYPGSLADIPALRCHLANPDAALPGARELAARLLTLPVYPVLSEEEVERIAQAFEDSAANVSRR